MLALQGGETLQQQWQCSPEGVEAVLVWQDKRSSSKVFLAGLYALICCRQLALGTPAEAHQACST